MMHNHDKMKLREIFNKNKLHNLLVSLSLLCRERADEIRLQPADRPAGALWDYAAEAIERLSDNDILQTLPFDDPHLRGEHGGYHRGDKK
jgi:hypothetical protein